MNQLIRFLSMVLVAVLIFLGMSMVGENTPYQGSILTPEQNNLYPLERITYAGEEGDVEISLKAEYDIRGVVKGKKKYSDYPSQVSQYDLILAWGDLNKEEYDQYVDYSQSGRWYYYTYDQEFVEEGFIARNSANVHLIAENDEVRRAIRKIRKNDYIRIKGHLVDVHFDNGAWESSMTRGDTGNGACEIILVEEIDIVD
ncbi:MAG: hypothetical protein NUK57_05415 [Gudongella sp.]|nr:hypothetical protein [Gudongella sp.]